MSLSIANNSEQSDAKPISPQGLVSKFWWDHHTKASGKVTSVLSHGLYESLADSERPLLSSRALGYEEAAQQCRSDVRNIVIECERTNNKFSDPEFDIGNDFSTHDHNCLFGIVRDCDDDDDDEGQYAKPSSVHRLPWIFEKPRFVTNDFTSDIKQGLSRNCWWLAALTTISSRKPLVNKIYVTHDEECSVYGFVFY
ncbi:hypothetical protein H9Q69_013553 [Fusarium xylarioides]|nr:hypothetical protein H9Q69_013553 [Fusarium xylarioides]